MGLVNDGSANADWVCDNDGTTGSGIGMSFPNGWVALNGSQFNEDNTGATGFDQIVVCGTCAAQPAATLVSAVLAKRAAAAPSS